VSDTPTITITQHGPYLVSGGLALREQAIGIDDAGNSWDWRDGPAVPAPERYALCRCGQSANKPFCDGSHARVGFDGTETAGRERFDSTARIIDGPTMTLADDSALCAFARFCDGYGRIWNTVTETDGEAARQIAARQAGHCPSGRLVVRDRQTSGSVLEPEFEPSIVLVEDPQQDASGPLWVRGGVTILAADGTAYEVRNRVTLCRCGQSSNKPFCDGTHAHVGFRAHPADPATAAT
jgi:CDGSH-type Zn-finger protein